jgi:hypothetical protein
MGSAPTATNGERKNVSNGKLENDEKSGGGQLRRSLLSSRWFRVLGASALLVGFAAGGFGIASATTSSGRASTAGAAKSGSRWGHQTGQLRGHHSPPAAAGTVESVTAGSGSTPDSFTVKGHDGTTVTVDVSSSTTYKDQGVASPSFANVTTGEMVSVEGTTASGVVTASSVFIGFGGGLFGHGTPPAAAGTVESVTAGSGSTPDSFTVKGHDGTTVTVDVSSSTTYKDQGVASPSFANVTTGEMVSVEGTTASGVVTASSVFIGFAGGMGRNHGHRGGFAPGWGS